ncbi:hypothetical protein [Isoptericola variabilis]|uniref:Bifunctional deaminase-reductase domain protein n=1 Tax=Isoptericola variabilis (strain 225) TaxID=743718 RepID=F6FX06_ISOV2|nr:hypothetical protein [Isoptericola variabilis]AEG44606.1 hypothetical protein Isova_1860 [Isoptericola variabilis 225]TWH28199.1 hypothetical protein L600_004400000150 [Isoptericola variabilis J7]
MMKIVVSNIVSLDGFVAGPHDDVLDLPMDQAFDAYNLERITAADTVLVGVASYRMFSYLKASRDGEAVVFGSPTTWQALLAGGSSTSCTSWWVR